MSSSNAIPTADLPTFRQCLQRELACLKPQIEKIIWELQNGQLLPAKACVKANAWFHPFLQKINQHFPEKILNQLYPKNHPLAITQASFQIKIERASYDYHAYELSETDYQLAITEALQDFLQILQQHS